MTKAIFFDMDGTLFQTTSILSTALDSTFNTLREDGSWQGETPLQTYMAIMGVPLPVVWQKLCPDLQSSNAKKRTVFFTNSLYRQLRRAMENYMKVFTIYSSSYSRVIRCL